MDKTPLSVQICYPEPHQQPLITLRVEAGTTIAQALALALPMLDLAQHSVGIFGKIKSVDTVLREGDRVEVYRPLQADPKESRRRRALHKAA